jgi:hemoglobin/transferrin/lactoferrin receptor protein
MFKDHFAVAGICLTAVALPVYADTASPDPATAGAELETVTVTVNRIAEPLADVAPNVGVVTRADLDRQGTDDLSNMFKTEPGVSVPEEPQRRGASGVTIRGIGGNRVLMTVDGERLPEGYSAAGRGAVAGRDWVEPDTLRQVEVVKGPASALFGSDAIGGMVNFRTFDPLDFVDTTKPDHLGLKLSYDGANKGWGTTATGAVAGKTVAGLLMVTRRGSQQIDNYGSTGGRGPTRSESDPQHNTVQNVLAKATLGLSGPHRLTVTAERYERQRDTELLADSAWATSRLQSNIADDSVTRERIGVDYHFTGAKTFAGADIKLYQQTLDASDRDSKLSSATGRYNDSSFAQRILGLDGQLNWRFGIHDVIAGVELNHIRTSRQSAATTTTQTSSTTRNAKYFPDNSSERVGVFAEDSIKLGSLQLKPALRYDHYRMRPHPDSIFLATSGTAQQSDFNDGAWSPKLGLSLPLGGGVSGFAGFNTGFRPPPFDSAFMARTARYGSVAYKIVQNPSLKSETSRGVDVGAKYAGGKVEAQLSAFYNRYRNFIDLQNLGTSGGYTIYQYQNRNQVAIRGVEARAAWNVRPSVWLSSTFAWAYGQDLTAGAPLNSVDPLTVTLAGEYRRDRWGGNLLWTLVKRKTRINQGVSNALFAAPGYGIVDLGGWVVLDRNIKLRAGLNNVFDKKYWQWATVNETYNTGIARDFYTEPRRNLTASMEISF